MLFRSLNANGALLPGRLAVFTYEVSVPEDAELSRPYFLREARDGARYVWPDDASLWGLARDPELVQGSASFGFVSDDPADVSAMQRTGRVTVSSDWRYVGVDPALGEFDKPVLVVPAVSVSVTPAGATWPQSKPGAQDVAVVVRAEAEQGSRGSVAMSAPSGWTVTPTSQAFTLDEAGAERSMTFQVRPDGMVAAGRHTFDVSAQTDDGRTYDEGYALIDYEHIERTALYSDATATVSVVPVAVREGIRVGYIMGSGDDGPEAIRQMGEIGRAHV